ncbi:MAG: hypothetical protein K2H20_03565 [Bacilli bacterium]|nr:hypothetical protein [Bacilli bacterium]
MLRENINDVNVVGTLKNCEYSRILRLDDGRLAKIISPFVFMLYMGVGASLESKIMDADSITGMDELYKPTSALYSHGVFTGYTMLENKGINFNEHDKRLTMRERSDLYRYANIHSQLEKIVKKGHKQGKKLVFPDIATCDNIYIDEKGNVSLIDYDGIQVGNNIAVSYSTNLGPDYKYEVPKYKHGHLYTEELDKTSLMILFFLDAFNVDLKVIGQRNPNTGKIITVKDFFDIMEFHDERLMKKVEKVLSSTEDGEFLEEDAFRIADEYRMTVYPVGEDYYIKRLIRK